MTKKDAIKILKDMDDALVKAEAEVLRLQELRREFINRYNLNKETNNEDMVDQPKF